MPYWPMGIKGYAKIAWEEDMQVAENLVVVLTKPRAFQLPIKVKEPIRRLQRFANAKRTVCTSRDEYRGKMQLTA